MAEEYPDILYRGIGQKECIDSNGYITAAAFQFEDYKDRPDQYCELSINWNDDEKSVERLKNQHKPFKDNKQFFCCTFIERNMLDIFFKEHKNNKIFDYERAPITADKENDIEENIYHGNLLLNKDISSQLKKNIQHSLATLAGQKKIDF